MAKKVKATTAPVVPARVTFDDGSYTEDGKYYLSGGEFSGYATLDEYFAALDALAAGGVNGADNGVGAGVDAAASGGQAEAGSADALERVQATSVVVRGAETVATEQDDGVAGEQGASAMEGGRSEGGEAEAGETAFGSALGVTPLPAPDIGLVGALGALYAFSNALVAYITANNALSDNDAKSLRDAQGNAFSAVLNCYERVKENTK